MTAAELATAVLAFLQALKIQEETATQAIHLVLDSLQEKTKLGEARICLPEGTKPWAGQGPDGLEYIGHGNTVDSGTLESGKRERIESLIYGLTQKRKRKPDINTHCAQLPRSKVQQSKKH